MNTTMNTANDSNKHPLKSEFPPDVSLWLRSENHEKIENLCHAWARQLSEDFKLGEFALPYAVYNYCTTTAMNPFFPALVMFDFALISYMCDGRQVVEDPGKLIGCHTLVPGDYTVVVDDAATYGHCFFHAHMAEDGEVANTLGGLTEIRLMCCVYKPVPADPSSLTAVTWS